MDEIGDELDDKSGNDKTGEELPELTNESDELNEIDDGPSEKFSELGEFDDIIPERFSDTGEFDDIIPERFSDTGEFDDIIPERFSDTGEFDDIIPERFSDTGEFDDIIPERFSDTGEFDDIIPERFSESDEFDDDILDDTIHDKEGSERAEEDQDSEDVGNIIENENIGSQSTSTVLTSEIEEIESNMERHEQEEEIEIHPEEYQDDTESIVNTEESEFIKDVEELAEYARETKGENESVEPQVEQENAAYCAEQYYETLKEKEVLNDQDSKEEQETEELRQEVTEELNVDQESGYKSDELEGEDVIEASKEITSTDEFEYLWEIRDNLDQEGKTSEEIEEVMHEAEEMYETLKNAEKIIEELELEKLKRVDHEGEATEEDLKEDLDREDLVEQAVELEEKLVQQGKLQEEIDVRVEESIEATKFEEGLEKIIEQQELEKLKLVDHEDEEEIDDAREEIDQPAEAEYYIEVEEELHRQGRSQEEIDEQMEEIASNYQSEINEKQEKEEEPKVNEELEKHDLETNEQNSSAEQCDQIELTSALSNEKKKESDEEENERLQELYRQETGRRPMYARQKSKGYSKWLEQRELGAEKINISKSENEKKKEIDEEGWKRTLKQWIKEASEEECNAELKSELKKALEIYNEFEDFTRKFLELYKKSQIEKLSEKEKNRLKSLLGRLHERDPIQFELLLSVFFIKKYITEQYWDDFWNKPLVNRLLSKFFKHISQKYRNLKKTQENKENSEVLKLELDAIEIESKDKKDFLEEITKLGSDESDEEGWKRTLKQWIKEASEEECNTELKSELKKALEIYNEFEYLARNFLELYEKSQYEKLTEIEKKRLKFLTKRLQELGPIQLELLANIRAFKDYFYNHLWELMNIFFVNRVRSKFFKHISQEYNRVILEYEDFKYTKQEINLRENNNTFEEKLQFNKSEIKVTNQEKALIREEDSAGIPIQRILEKINNHKENIENDFYFKKSFPLFPTSKVTLTPHKQSSVGRKKNISIDINNLNFHNLLDELLLKSYEEFYTEHFALNVKNPYANTGRTLRAVFINWIKERYSNDNPKKDILLEKINNINENEEIAQYILYLLINSNVTQIGLNSILLKIHLNVSRETVRTIAEKNFSNEDYKKKFSKGDGWNKFSLQNSENYKKLIFSSLLNKELHKFFEQYYMNTGNYANFGKKITKNFIDWIKQRNINASKKKDIFELIENINKNKEILNYIIYQVKNYINSNSLDRLPLKVFSNKFTPLFLTVSDITIQRIITKHIFQGNINEFRKLFPVGGRKKKRIVDFVNLSFENLLNSSLIDRFRVYKEIFYTPTNHIYANHGMEITEDFIKWININECDITEKENLTNLCKKINENEEILSFIIHLTLNTNYNLSEIARELNLINLNGQRNTITRIVKEYIFNFDKEEFDNRFHTSDIVSQTGLSTHLCLNSLISLFFNKNSIYRYYSEIRIFPPSNKQADGFFLNFKFSRFFYDRLTKFEDSERLIKALNIKKDLLNKVVGVQIEFTSDLSDENILSKCTKYQNNLILLIIVGTNWKHKNNNRQIIPNISEILYPDKVLIINPKLFAKLLNFDSSFIQEFNKILEYSKNSDIESLERYNDNIYHRITFYDTNDLIKDIELRFFEKYFYDPEIELNEMEIPQLFSKFITYCKNNFSSLEFKTITRGSSIGTYYIFDTLHLKQFNSQIDMSYNLISLADILGNYIGQDKIFFKKITKPNSDGNLRDKRRSILIESSFLDNY